MPLENYALSNTIQVKKAELEQKKSMLGDLERDLAERREHLNRTKDTTSEWGYKDCGNPERRSEERKG